MMNKAEIVHDLIVHRRSCKKYDPDKMVPDEIIDRIIDSGLNAANGRGKQSAIIIAVTNKEIRDKLSKKNAEIGNRDHDPFFGAPAVLIVLADTTVGTYVNDGSLVIGNMMIQAEAEGVNACWIHRAKEEFEDDLGKEIMQSLNIDPKYAGIGHLILGYAADNAVKDREIKPNRVYYLK